MRSNRSTSRSTVHRRDFVRIGSVTALGLGMSDWLQLSAQGAIASSARAKRCILIWLDGGPSHLETFDLKPDAPREVRGPFRSIKTNVSGIEICEHLPRISRIADKLAIIRSITSPLGEHGLANQYLMTGYPPSPVLSYPSYGAVLTHLRDAQSDLPPYIAVPNTNSGDAGFLGSQCEPFATGGDPSRGDFHVRDIDLFPDVDESRLLRRRDYLRHLDATQRPTEERQSDSHESNGALDQAYRLLTSAQSKRAFNLQEEPDSVRERYGPKMLGQSCLLARRLIERAVPFVTVTNTGWDTHENLTLQLRDGYSGAKTGVGLLPTFDQAFSALVGDLSERNLLDETLVIAMGEFGRTPKLNMRGGRDHWPRVFSLVMAGGGVQGGQVIGSSDQMGESPRDRPVTPADLACSLYTLLGVDPHHELVTPEGRPITVNRGGHFISELV